MRKEPGFNNIYHKKWPAILLIELVLLAAAAAVCVLHPAQMAVGAERTEELLTEGIALKPGVYRAVLSYETEVDMACQFLLKAEPELPFRGLRANPVTLFAQEEEAVCEFYLTASCKELQAVIKEDEEGSVQVKSVEIWDTGAGGRILIFWVLCDSCLINGLLMLYWYQKKHPFPLAGQLALAGVGVTVLAASLPLTVDYVINGEQIALYLTAAEKLSRGQGVWGSKEGLCVAVPALFRRIGLSMGAAYRLYLFVLNGATAILAYLAARKWRCGQMAALTVCMWYVLNPWRITCLYEKNRLEVCVLFLILIFLLWAVGSVRERLAAGSGKAGMPKRMGMPEGLGMPEGTGMPEKTCIQEKRSKFLKLGMGILIAACLLISTRQTNRILLTGRPLWVYSMANMENGQERGLSWMIEGAYGMKE